MKLAVDKIIQPMMSEKVTKLEQKYNQYSVVVDKKMTKLEIKSAITKIFGVAPLNVNTINFRKKTKKTRFGIVPAKGYKKAIIKLPDGKRLELK